MNRKFFKKQKTIDLKFIMAHRFHSKGFPLHPYQPLFVILYEISELKGACFSYSCTHC
uniref:Uncharacterized protein n=1 Tax=Rhizophora mucronata TaxID=61149 RepID=A0A2P2NKY2_RHIMU